MRLARKARVWGGVEEPMTPAERTQVAAIFAAAADLTIATNRADGWPQATTVSYVSDGPTIYFGTWAKSQKAQNIERDPRVSIAVTAPYASWDKIQGVSLGGRAQRVTESGELERVFKLMVGKFPQIGQFVKAGDAEMALYRIEPEIVSILDYTKGFGHTQLVSA